MPRMRPFDQNLRDAVERLYSAFSAYPEPASLEGSPSTDVEGMVRALRAAPLRDLTADQVGPYAGSALLTVGILNDYKHYLPRILEHAVLGSEHLGTDPPIIAQRLVRGSWRTWPGPEQHALKDLYLAAWSWGVDQHPDDFDASIWLCAIAGLEQPVRPLLADWGQRRSAEALLQAAWLWTMVKEILTKAEHDLAYWSYVSLADRQLVFEWVNGAERMDAFFNGLSVVAEDDQWRLEQALCVTARGSA